MSIDSQVSQGPPRLGRRALLGGGAALGAGLMTAGLSACGSPTSISSDPNELVAWYWNRSLDPELLKTAATQIPGTSKKLRADIIGGSFDTKLRTSLAGGAYIPDVTNINSNCALYFPNEDQFVDLNTLGAQSLKDDYYDWKWQLGTTPSGRFIFFPLDTGPTGFYYRKDLFDKAGIESEPDAVASAVKTWEGYIEVGKKLAANGGAKIAQTAVNVFNGYVNASPERYFDENDKPIFDNTGSAIQKAWAVATQAVAAKITGNRQTSTDQNSALVSGSTGGHIEAVWWAQILQDTAPDAKGNWRLAAQPMNPGNSGGSFMAIPRACKDPETAFKFITWLNSPENQATSYNRMQLFPSAPGAFTTGTIKSTIGYFGDQDPLPFFSDAAKGVPPRYISTHESLIGAFSLELANVETGAKTPDQAWTDASDEVNRVLKKRGVI